MKSQISVSYFNFSSHDLIDEVVRGMRRFFAILSLIRIVWFSFFWSTNLARRYKRIKWSRVNWTLVNLVRWTNKMFSNHQSDIDEILSRVLINTAVNVEKLAPNALDFASNWIIVATHTLSFQRKLYTFRIVLYEFRAIAVCCCRNLVGTYERSFSIVQYERG